MPITLKVEFSGLCAFVLRRRPVPNILEANALLLDASAGTLMQMPPHSPRLIVETRFTSSPSDEVITLPGGGAPPKEYAVWNLTGPCRFVRPPGAPGLVLDSGNRRAGITGAYIAEYPTPDGSGADQGNDTSWVGELERAGSVAGQVDEQYWFEPLKPLIAARVSLSFGKLSALFSSNAARTKSWDFREYPAGAAPGTYRQALADQMVVNMNSAAEKIVFKISGRPVEFTADSNGNMPEASISNMPTAPHDHAMGMAGPDPWVHHVMAYYEVSQAFTDQGMALRLFVPWNVTGNTIGGRRLFCPVSGGGFVDPTP